MKSWKKSDDWFWEGNIQNRLAAFLREQGFTVSETDTLSKKAGVDILAHRLTEQMLVEVKGWPSDKYMDGPKSGERKKTNPSVQAGHWFSEAVVTLIKRKSKYPNHILALALPDFPRYQDLIMESRWALQRLAIRVFLVSENQIQQIL